MAINVKEILADGLLELLEQQRLESIKIKQLLDYTHISKQSFYNHFLDKNDLIVYIYLNRKMSFIFNQSSHGKLII